MNRKLRNTILAFSVTGTVLALGLLASRPVMPDNGLMPAATAAAATDPADAASDRVAEPAAARLDAAAADGIEAGMLARHQFEDDIAGAASLESAMAMTAGFVATATTQAVVAEILTTEIPAATGTDRADTDAASTPRRGRSLRGAFAVPYFSFARGMGRGGRS